jgi:5S rRNA maturation endonuclease (ribonuclease M5)
MQVDGKIPLGYVHCFGCGSKGPWNKLAEVANLEKIKEWQKSSGVSDTLVTRDLEESLLGDTGITFKGVLRKMQCEEAIRWPITLDWRGFKGQLIHDVGGHIINDERNESVGVLFPVKINGKVRGGIKAIYEKKEKKDLAYVNMRGDWSKKYGLFPYMYAHKIIKKRKCPFVFVVEGPRDALRLCSIGIPAVAILGATSMSEIKALLIVNLGVTHVYIMSDNDKGGDTMAKTTKKWIKATEAVKVRRLKLPRPKDKDGNVIKMDPGNAPKKVIRNLLEFLKEEHEYKAKPL